MISLLVIAKAPLAGRSKTRLTPPLLPPQAAQLAEAALADTLEAVAQAPARRRFLILDGAPGAWLPEGFEIIPQGDGGLDERIAAAFEEVRTPALIIGMDTPQLTPQLLTCSMRVLARTDVDAVLGPTEDGGYWAIGLKHPIALATLGVPMSSPDTFEKQLERLKSLGLRTRLLPCLTDVDTIEDAHTVAEAAPASRFARKLDRFDYRCNVHSG